MAEKVVLKSFATGTSTFDERVIRSPSPLNRENA